MKMNPEIKLQKLSYWLRKSKALVQFSQNLVYGYDNQNVTNKTFYLEILRVRLVIYQDQKSTMADIKKKTCVCLYTL